MRPRAGHTLTPVSVPGPARQATPTRWRRNDGSWISRRAHRRLRSSPSSGPDPARRRFPVRFNAGVSMLNDDYSDPTSHQLQQIFRDVLNDPDLRVSDDLSVENTPTWDSL